MIPVNYVVRNLARRRLRTTLTIIGIAMVVAVYFVMASVAETMVQSFRSTGAPDELVVVQAGAMTVDFSNIDRGSLTFLQTREDIAEIDGRPLVSPELALGSYATIGGRSRKVSIRGVTHEAPGVYQQAHLLEGSWPVSGFQGAIGITLASKYGIGIGDTVSFRSGLFPASWLPMGASTTRRSGSTSTSSPRPRIERPTPATRFAPSILRGSMPLPRRSTRIGAFP
jgi:ABC-type lipoprotein release transport system permease subunit